MNIYGDAIGEGHAAWIDGRWLLARDAHTLSIVAQAGGRPGA